jgi:hypothetical protein
MKIKSFENYIAEKRRNPDKNVQDKVSIVDIIQKINLEDNLKNWFLSFRDKLTTNFINYNTAYNTPAGYYSYPAVNYLRETGVDKNLSLKPFIDIYNVIKGYELVPKKLIEPNSKVIKQVPEVNLLEIKNIDNILSEVYENFQNEVLKIKGVSPYKDLYKTLLEDYKKTLNILNFEDTSTNSRKRNLYKEIQSLGGKRKYLTANLKDLDFSNFSCEISFHITTEDNEKVFVSSYPYDDYTGIPNLFLLKLYFDKTYSLHERQKGISRNLKKSYKKIIKDYFDVIQNYFNLNEKVIKILSSKLINRFFFDYVASDVFPFVPSSNYIEFIKIKKDDSIISYGSDKETVKNYLNKISKELSKKDYEFDPNFLNYIDDPISEEFKTTIRRLESFEPVAHNFKLPYIYEKLHDLIENIENGEDEYYVPFLYTAVMLVSHYVESNSPVSRISSSVFKKAGINGFIDYGDEESFIHPNEPSQALFLSSDIVEERQVVNIANYG